MGNARYERQKTLNEARRRHQKGLDTLTKKIENEYEYTLAETSVKCRPEGGRPSVFEPSEWTDWDSNPDRREYYELDRPDLARASEMCAGCPLLESGLCLQYAELTGQSHGVWGGVVFENGRRVKK